MIVNALPALLATLSDPAAGWAATVTVACLLHASFYWLAETQGRSKDDKAQEWKPKEGDEEHSASDKGTTPLTILYAVGAIAVPLVAHYADQDRWPVIADALDQFAMPAYPWLRNALLAGQVAAIALRLWSMKTLGRFFTRTLRTTDDQTLCTSGPYHWVRHPGYAATNLNGICLGFAVSHNWAVGSSIVLLCLYVYTSRISAEEKMLAASFGRQWDEYKRRTTRLIPYVL